MVKLENGTYRRGVIEWENPNNKPQPTALKTQSPQPSQSPQLIHGSTCNAASPCQKPYRFVSPTDHQTFHPYYQSKPQPNFRGESFKDARIQNTSQPQGEDWIPIPPPPMSLPLSTEVQWKHTRCLYPFSWRSMRQYPNLGKPPPPAKMWGDPSP